MRLILLALAVAVIGCGKPSRYASGSGYGVGIPRVNFMLGETKHARGLNTQGFKGEPAEYGGPVWPEADDGSGASNEARPRTGGAPR